METPTVRRVRARGLQARRPAVGRVPSRGVEGCEISRQTGAGPCVPLARGGKPDRHIRVFITHRFRCSDALAPVNAPASWPSMDRTKPQPDFPFPRRKTKHRFVRVRASTAGGALADLCQRLAVRSNCLFKPLPEACPHNNAHFCNAPVTVGRSAEHCSALVFGNSADLNRSQPGGLGAGSRWSFGARGERPPESVYWVRALRRSARSNPDVIPLWHPSRGAGPFLRRCPEVAAPKNPRRPPATIWQPFGLPAQRRPGLLPRANPGAGRARQRPLHSLALSDRHHLHDLLS